MSITTHAQTQQNGHYAHVNGLQLYYELHGDGSPLVLLHGGGSTIETTFGRILPQLAIHHKVIAVESQSHGHTPDIDRPTSFERDADDVAALLKELKIDKADFMGFSNGGTTCLQIAIRHPQLVNKLVLASALYKRSGVVAGFFEGMEQASIDNMPAPLKEAYLKINPSQEGLLAMFNRDATRMRHFRDIPDSDIKSIQAPALVVNADADVILVEHALQLARTLPHGKLAIIPGVHGEYIGEICTPNPSGKLPGLVVAMIEEFLKG
jgi:Predicted hydrolases or acyltransferases (alpha/beta hydrolase superfamily)